MATLGLKQRNDLIESHLQLIELVTNLVLRRVSRRRAELREEFLGQCAVLLVEAARRFEPSSGVPFRLWAKRFMMWRVIELIRRRNYRDDNHQRISPVLPVRESEAEERPAVDMRKLEAALARLTSRQYSYLLRQVASDQSVREIAVEFGVSPAEVRRELNVGLQQLAADPDLQEFRHSS